MSTAEIAGIVEMAAEKANDPEKFIRCNIACGYFINKETGFLDYDPRPQIDLRKLAPSLSFRVAGENRSGFNRSEASRKVEEAMMRKKREIEAAIGMTKLMNEPAIEVAKKPIRRVRKEHRSKHGMFVTKNTLEAFDKAEADEKSRKEELASLKEKEYWEKHRTGIRTAERALAAADDDVSRLLCKDLKNIIIGRTQHGARGKNKDELVEEARSLLGKALLLPPTPEKPSVVSSLLVEGADDGQDESKEGMDVDNEGSDADALADYRCGDCGKENPEVSFSGTAMFCCECGARVWEAGESFIS